MRADLVVVDTNHVSLAARSGAQLLDSYVFAAGRSAVRDVMVGGRWVVEGGRHAGDEAARDAYVGAVKRMLAG
jgi:formimidoylglutamate deiminase